MILLRHKLTGQETKWPDGESYNGLEWKAIGSSTGAEVASIEEQFEKHGIKWGDAIAWVTKQFGVSQCGGCRARQEVLNHLNQLGLAETIRQIKATL